MNPAVEIPFDEGIYVKLIQELKARTGVSLLGYRPKVAQRRIERRARKLGCAGVEDYLAYLRKNSEEAEKLISFVTIPVGRFFRNREVFEMIERDVFPAIFDAKRPGEEVLIWSAGCGEGEEIYSIAMIIMQGFSTKMKQNPPRLIGSDVNPAALEKARSAGYEYSRTMEMAVELKNRYFQRSGNCLEVKDYVRKMVEFRLESILEGKGVADSDMVLMRNLLIYFDREHQDLLLKKVARCLKPGGFLALGKSETLPAKFKGDFKVVSSQNRIYRKASL